MKLKIKKRDGRVVPYDVKKIEISIKKAMESVGIENGEDIVFLVEEKIKEINKYPISVEDVQDIIEECLMDLGYNSVAKAYILYREKHKRQRQLKDTLEIVDDLKLGLNAAKLLKTRYLERDIEGKIVETPSELFRRVAKHVAEADLNYDKKADVEIVEELFYRAMVNMEFLPNSPTLFSAGRNNNTLAACFCLDIEDTLEDIFEKVKQTGIITKMGGGVGLSFSNLRPKNSPVGSTGGISSGPVSFMRVFDTAIDVCKQGGVRRGALMGVLRIDHPDILEFIQSKNDKKSFRNFNISVLVTDKFMTAYYDDETYDLINPHNGEVVKKLPARLVMDYIVFSAHSCGDPGMVFIDRINKKHSLRNLEIKGVNVCIGKDVLVPSKDGMTKISDVKGAVYNGKKKLYRIFTKDGYELDATEDHKILTDVGWKEVRDLSCDDNLTLSVLSYFGDRGTYEAGLISGWYLGDGWHTGKDDRATLAFYGKDKGDLVSFYHDAVKKELGQDLLCTESENRIDIRSRKILKLIDIWGLKDKKNLDMLFESTKDFQKGFLQGLFTADGYFKGKSTSKFVVSLAQSNLNTLKKVQLLLLNFGVKSHIYENRRLAGYREMPDGKGGMKSYWCEANHELDITGMDAEIFANDIGFLLRYKQEPLIHLLQTPARGPYKRSFTTGFMKIEELGEDDVYDLVNMPGHRFSANGIVVHNCGEQPLAPNESCLLGAINLSKFVKDEKVNYKELRRIVTLVVHFLDNLIDVNNYPLKQIDVATRKARKIGVGIMGWAEMLIQLGVPYDSKEALELAESVMGFIDNEAHKASRDLAVVRGNFPLFDDYKRNYRNMRNAVVTTAAPTGSRSILADTSSGIEPLFSVAQTRVTGDGMILSDFNKYFIKALEDRGLWNEELKLLVGKKGHVGDIDGIPDDIRELYKTSHEIPSLQHVLMQAAFQKHIGSSVSKTVNFNNDATLEDVRDVYLKAYETGCKGITVYRDGSLGKQVLYAGCETCDL